MELLCSGCSEFACDTRRRRPFRVLCFNFNQILANLSLKELLFSIQGDATRSWPQYTVASVDRDLVWFFITVIGPNIITERPMLFQRSDVIQRH